MYVFAPVFLEKFLPEMHLRLEFISSVCRPFTKNKERTRKFKETRDLRYIYRNELDKVCFQHEMLIENLKI